MPALAALHPLTEIRLDAWRADPAVLGVVLVGSKSRGHADDLSDDDLEVLLTDDAYARLAPVACAEYKFLEDEQPPKLAYDAQYMALSGLQAKARSLVDLDRWPYERAQVLFDRDGATALAVAEAARMPEDFRRARLVHGALDVWLAIHRAQKTRKRGYEAAARQIVAKGAKALARVLFALEGRWVPLDHWLEAELATLADAAQAAPCLRTALLEASPEALTEALARLETTLAPLGFPPPGTARRELFLTLVHPSYAAERQVHGLI